MIKLCLQRDFYFALIKKGKIILFSHFYTYTVGKFTSLHLGKNPAVHAFSLDNDPNCDICDMVLD